jgi:hypothetical protein
MASVPFSNATTSRRAAKEMERSGEAASQRALVLLTLRNNPRGLTDQMLAKLTGLELAQARTRRHTLEIEGYVRDTGRTMKAGKNPRIIWEATADGQIPLNLPRGIRTRPALRAYRDRVMSMIREVQVSAADMPADPWRGWKAACDDILKRMEVLE